MKSLLCLGIIAAFLFLFAVNAEAVTIEGIQYDGRCNDYIILVNLGETNGQCWDVKIDIPGRVQNPARSGQIRSSYYYMSKAVCPPENYSVIGIYPESRENLLQGVIKVRPSGSEGPVVEKPFNIAQQCPAELNDTGVLLVLIIIALVFGYLLIWWHKQK